jgi:serine/threonine protein kinase
MSEALLRLVEHRQDIGERFVDVRRLDPNGGSGQFSLMFTATDTTTGRRVAIKVFNPLRTDDYRLSSFRREGEVLQRLTGEQDIIRPIAPQSAFTAELHAEGLEDVVPLSFPYYAVELAQESVAAALARDAWGAEQKLLVFRAMCRSVQRIHAQQIVHRDLKPENFLVMFDSAVKLSDFGTSKSIEEPNQAHYVGPPGDLRYTAPELLSCLHAVDPGFALAADIYSLGAILFELFSGSSLGTVLFNRSYVNDLIRHMAHVPTQFRSDVYNGFVRGLASAHPLPSVSAYERLAPASIAVRIDQLYRSLACLDYHTRLCDFARIYRQIDICVLIVRHQAAYDRWNQEKRRRRLIRIAKKTTLTGGRPC